MATNNEKPNLVFLTKREIQVLVNICRVGINLRDTTRNDTQTYLDSLSPEMDELYKKFLDKYRELGGSDDPDGQ